MYSTELWAMPEQKFLDWMNAEVSEPILKSLPAVDAVPVVRCRDCNEYQQNFHWCKLHDGEMQPTDYCSYGERREEDGTVN